MRLSSVAIIFMLSMIFMRPCQGQENFVIEKVTKADLEMNRYLPDTSAQAVILFDKGHLYNKGTMFTRNLRIKILKKSGLHWGNRVFNTPSKSAFKVTVYNLVNGEVITEKASDKSTYHELVVEELGVYKVFAPNVKVGSIIDISYQHYGPPFEWRFQELIPVVYSDLVIEGSRWPNFSRTFYGFESIQTISPEEWRASNMPAFKAEPFINSPSNYLTRFQFQVQFYSWREVTSGLNKLSQFGGILTGSAFLNDFASSMKERKDLTTQQKIEASVAYIRSNMRWNQRSTLYGSISLRNNFLVDHNGSSADINLSLIALLNKMDITTYPVVLSTRSNGLMVEWSPTVNKLNYVVGLVQHDGLEMFVDGTSSALRVGMLPARCLNGNGLIVKTDTAIWVPLSSAFKNTMRQYTDLIIDGKSQATAKVTRDFEGYGYVEWVDTLKANHRDAELIRNKIRKQNSGLEIISYQIINNDTLKGAAKEMIDVDVANQLIEDRDELLITPFFLFEYTNNPLKSPERKYPLDLLTPHDVTSIVSVRLPAGYSVKDLPPSEKLSIPSGSANFTYLAQANKDNTILFKVVVKLSKQVYSEVEYLELRQFFSYIAKKINAPIRVGKI